jgi:glycosyltransferase involved in cell wall biosynthesis
MLTSVNTACCDCWGWLVQKKFLESAAEGERTLLHKKGAMARWTPKAKELEVFPAISEKSVYIHGKRYSLGKSQPHFVYNINMSKVYLTERDRQRPPHNWPHHTIKVFLDSTKSWEEDDKAKHASELTLKGLEVWETRQTPIRRLVETWRIDDHRRQKEMRTKQLRAQEDLEERRSHLEAMAERLKQAASTPAWSMPDDDDGEDGDTAISSLEVRKDCDMEMQAQVEEVQKNIRGVKNQLGEIVVRDPVPPIAVIDAAPVGGNSNAGIFSVLCVPKDQSKWPSAAEVMQGLSPLGKELKDALTVVCRHIPGTVKIVRDTPNSPFWDSCLSELCVSAPQGDQTTNDCVLKAITVLQRDCDRYQEATAAMLIAAARSDSHKPPPPPSARAASKFRPLLLIDEWGTRTGGIAAFNYQLACDLAELADTAVYVCLTQGDSLSVSERRQHPTISFVQLINGIPHIHGQEGDITTLIGHGDITGDLLSSISAKEQFKHCNKWLFLHTTPRKVDPLKKKEANAEAKHVRLVKLAEHADAVFCVGQYMFEYWEPSIPTKLEIYHPILNRAFVPKSDKPMGKGDFNVSMFGRTEGVLSSKGFDMLKTIHKKLQTVRLAVSGPAVNLVLRGIEGNKHSDCKCSAAAEARNADFIAARDKLGVANALVQLKAYGSHDDVRKDLSEAQVALMPSIVEPFGLAGLEALAAGVLPIVPAESGLAIHLRKFVREGMLASYLDQIIVAHEEDPETRANLWAEKLAYIYTNRERAPPLDTAIALRNALLEGEAKSPQILYDIWSGGGGASHAP